MGSRNNPHLTSSPHFYSSPVSDRPGGIAMLTKHIAAAGASIKDIIHERSWLYHSVDQVGRWAWATYKCG